MFTNVEVRPVYGLTGNVREIIAESDHSFFSVAIECFVKTPPPPGLKPCPQCGILGGQQFQSGQPIRVDLDDMVAGSEGTVEIILTDGNSQHKLQIPFDADRGMAAGQSLVT